MGKSSIEPQNLYSYTYYTCITRIAWVTIMDVCIKGVDKDVWRDLKVEAAKYELPLGRFIGKVIKDYKMKGKKGNIKDILYGEKPLKGILSRDDYKKIRESFRRNLKLRY